MFSTNFFIRFKEHKQYLYISILFIAIYFVGTSLITSRITSVTKDLMDDLIQGNLKSKENIVAFEYKQLENYLINAQTILESTTLNNKTIAIEQLQFIADLALENHSITNSFVLDFALDNKKTKTKETDLDTAQIQKTIASKLVANKIGVDTIFTKNGRVINRKVFAVKMENNSTLIFGYEVDLLAFWDYFSENYRGDGGYTVVTNKTGVCLLHPDPSYIGKKLPNYFNQVSIDSLLQNALNINGYYVPSNTKLIKRTAISEYIGLEVLRYYDSVTIGNNSLIVVVSFPIEIHLKETTANVQRYFSWISLLAFVTFMLILIVSRLQLKKEYEENLRVVEEKEQLVYANEKYQKENAVLQLNQLKKKMHPHFLFNSLNSLHVLIDLNPDLSQQFVLKLADVYRYLLEERDGNLISVKKEITFLEQYVFLQEIRFKNSLNVSIINQEKAKVLQRKIPFLSLETLVENAIKHNEITKQNPLFIEVVIKDKHIEVSNNYTPRDHKKKLGYHIGLKYLENTYQYYQINGFTTQITKGKFICTLPFIFDK